MSSPTVNETIQQYMGEKRKSNDFWAKTVAVFMLSPIPLFTLLAVATLPDDPPVSLGEACWTGGTVSVIILLVAVFLVVSYKTRDGSKSMRKARDRVKQDSRMVDEVNGISQKILKQSQPIFTAATALISVLLFLFLFTCFIKTPYQLSLVFLFCILMLLAATLSPYFYIKNSYSIPVKK